MTKYLLIFFILVTCVFSVTKNSNNFEMTTKTISVDINRMATKVKEFEEAFDTNASDRIRWLKIVDILNAFPKFSSLTGLFDLQNPGSAKRIATIRNDMAKEMFFIVHNLVETKDELVNEIRQTNFKLLVEEMITAESLLNISLRDPHESKTKDFEKMCIDIQRLPIRFKNALALDTFGMKEHYLVSKRKDLYWNFIGTVIEYFFRSRIVYSACLSLEIRNATKEKDRLSIANVREQQMEEYKQEIVDALKKDLSFGLGPLIRVFENEAEEDDKGSTMDLSQFADNLRTKFLAVTSDYFFFFVWDTNPNPDFYAFQPYNKTEDSALIDTQDAPSFTFYSLGKHKKNIVFYQTGKEDKPDNVTDAVHGFYSQFKPCLYGEKKQGKVTCAETLEILMRCRPEPWAAGCIRKPSEYRYHWPMRSLGNGFHDVPMFLFIGGWLLPDTKFGNKYLIIDW